MPIKCPECVKTGLPHGEHSTREELKQRRRLEMIARVSPEERAALREEFLRIDREAAE